MGGWLLTVARRHLTLVALVSLCILSLVACGGGPQSQEVTAAPDNDEVTETPEPNPGESPRAAIPVPSEPIAPLDASGGFAPEKASGAVEGIPAPTNTAPIVAVANYFGDLPGIDMSSLQPGQREKFLHRANSELCTCGCKNDTLAKCYMNDPNCDVVKGMLLAVLDEVRSGK
jgi:hypothetical protein